MIPLRQLKLFEPRDLGDAVRMMSVEAPLAPLAGCTDVYVDLNSGRLGLKRFINLWSLDELRQITYRDGVLRIGALATFTTLKKSQLVRKHCPSLAAAAGEIGGPQIQNRGTLGGNIVSGSPAGDTLPVLAIAEAVLILRSLNGERCVPFLEFYTGYRKNLLRSDELLVGIEIPLLEGRQWFRKVGTRAAQAVAKVVFAGLRGRSPKIALGSVAPTVRRLAATESCLASGGSLAQAQEILLTEIAPIEDFRASVAYRKKVAQNLLAQFWEQTR